MNTKKAATKGTKKSKAVKSVKKEKKLPLKPINVEAIKETSVKVDEIQPMLSEDKETTTLPLLDKFTEAAKSHELNIAEKLQELAVKYGTDKIDHGYLEHYAKHLDNPKSILEIGVLKGASVKMWHELFPEAEIHGIDLFEEFDVRSELGQLGIICHKGNQDDYDFLYSIENKFDVIIDDASHMADATTITFKHCLENMLVSGGLFFVEDLHCHKERYYWNSIHSFEDTLLWVFQNWTSEKGLPENRFFDSHQKAVYDRLIDSVELINDKLAIIRRK